MSEKLKSRFSIMGHIGRASEKYRRRYGQIRGFWLWLNLRRHLWIGRGRWYGIHVPGLDHKIILRAGTSDVLVFTQIFVEGELEFEMGHVPKNIVDAGENIGLASVYLANRFPNARILALEVEQANFELLKQNTSWYPNITCMRKALWSGQGKVGIVNQADEPWAFRVSAAAVGDNNSIPSVGVGDLVKQFEEQRIDLLKIDIEGAEKEVFQDGVGHWIDKIGVIAVELHERINPGCGKALTDALVGRHSIIYQSGEYTVVHLTGQY